MSRLAVISCMLLANGFGQDRGVESTGMSARDLYLRKASPHFGVRYNLVQLFRNGKPPQDVDPDFNFQQGDCLAVRLTPNRGGRLFVFNQGAGGKWQALLPSASEPDEPNSVMADIPAQIPAAGCFEIDNSHGIEVLLVVVTGENSDPNEVSESARSTAARIIKTAPRQLALTSRELAYQKVKAPLARGEPANSIYVASSISAEVDQIAIAIKIRHE